MTTTERETARRFLAFYGTVAVVALVGAAVISRCVA